MLKILFWSLSLILFGCNVVMNTTKKEFSDNYYKQKIQGEKHNI